MQAHGAVKRDARCVVDAMKQHCTDEGVLKETEKLFLENILKGKIARLRYYVTKTDLENLTAIVGMFEKVRITPTDQSLHRWSLHMLDTC